MDVPTEHVPPSRRSVAVALVVLACACVAAYSNTFHVPFQFDDVFCLVRSKALHDPVDVRAVFDYYPSRFLAMWTFALNYSLAGENVVPYHVVNLGLHVGASFLVFFLVLETLRRTHPLPELTSILVAGSTAGVFALHPLTTEAVTYIWQRMEVASALLGLAACLLYLRAVARDGPVRRVPYGLALLFALLAAAFKETAAAIPLLIFLLDLFLVERPVHPLRARMRLAAPFLCAFALPTLLIALTGKLWNEAPIEHIGAGTFLSPWRYLLTQLKGAMLYLKLVIVPVGQNIEHDIAPASTLLDVRVLLAALTLAVLVALSLLARRRSALIPLGVLWCFLALAPSSSLFPLEDLVFEHRMYPALAGVAIAAAGIAAASRAPFACAVVFSGVAVFFGSLTHARNDVWRSRASLWADSVVKSPDRLRPHLNYGAALLDLADLDAAEREYRRALELGGNNVVALYNLSEIALARGDIDSAERFAAEAVRTASDHVPAIVQAAQVCIAREKFSEARGLLERALALQSEYPTANNLLAVLLMRSGDLDRAEALLDRAIASAPDWPNPYYNRIMIEQLRNRPDAAVRRAREFVSRFPQHPKAVQIVRSLQSLESPPSGSP
ncbi:MAG: tetratricopeptide repeat protein [Planctomycetota bacterium]